MKHSTEHAVRYDFLDWLRVIAIAVLLFYHTGMLFVGWDFHIQNAEVIAALQRPMEVSHRLRMPLLFVIAGAGLWFAARRRTNGAVMAERTRRLLVPLVLGMFIIVPPQIYVERLWRGQWDGDYLSFLVERVLQLQPYPAGDFSWHHLWFILYLYLYVPLLLPLLVVLKRVRSLQPGSWLYVLALPLGVNEALLKPWFPVTHALIGDWYCFVHYLLLTAYGLLLASMPGSWDWLARYRTRSLMISTIVTGTLFALLDLGVVQRETAIESVLANWFTWCWLLTALGYGRRYLSKDTPALRWARDASYPIYILHQTVMLLVAYWVIAQSYDPWTKYGIILTATIVFSVALYELGRRIAVTRLILGMRPIRTEPRCERTIARDVS
ncbi:MAG: acyltransferase [Gammaproteobacteria bacterium]|nr:acyltransferase [Gammaproteobacteria bacterium]